MNPKTLYKKAKKGAGNAVLTGLVALAGAGCGWVSEPVLREPTRGGFNHTLASFGEYKIIEDELRPRYSLEGSIADLNGDGQADVIALGRKAYWIAPGTEAEFKFYTKDAEIMTPEIREAATRELNAERNLNFLLAKERYRLQQEKQGDNQ